MNDLIGEIDEKYSISDLKLLMGIDEVSETKPFIILLARALNDPFRLPWLLKDICGLCLDENEISDLRMALVRVQVDAELRMNEDIQRYQQRRYVAQVIEILMFQELMLAPKETEEEIG
ncbi:MAG: hypothetical protein MUO26_08470 [Methanotrichaceae archaeon]|nr:hypothetical protein [Methanotrichaceae archaeon]